MGSNESSTRRFRLLPSALALSAMGASSPKPTVSMRTEMIFLDNRYCATELARLSDRTWLYSLDPTLSVCPATTMTVFSNSCNTNTTESSTS